MIDKWAVGVAKETDIVRGVLYMPLPGSGVCAQQILPILKPKALEPEEQREERWTE